MDKFDICLVESVNGISFGSDRAIVRNALGNNFKVFRKSRYSKNTTDDFGVCHVFYSSDDTLDAIEIFPGAAICVNSAEISFEYPALIEWVKHLDPEAAADSDGIVSKKLSIGVYAPYEQCESILFGKQGYYK